MASEASGQKKRGMGRGPNHIPKSPTNKEERTLIHIRSLGPNSKVVKCISQLCLQNWPTPAITWASTPIAHKDAMWAEFQKRYRWADEDCPAIVDIFLEEVRCSHKRYACQRT